MTEQQYGNGATWDSFANDPMVSLPLLEALSTWFVVLQPKARPSTVDDPTDNFDLGSSPSQEGLGPRKSTGVFTGAATTPGAVPLPGGDRFVFRIRRGPQSQFDFVSVGRNANNDVYVPDDSISRFHAFFRETPTGLVILDAKSQNGTSVRGLKVPHQGGEPMKVSAGDPVRFGEINGVVVDAAGLFALVCPR